MHVHKFDNRCSKLPSNKSLDILSKNLLSDRHESEEVKICLVTFEDLDFHWFEDVTYLEEVSFEMPHLSNINRIHNACCASFEVDQLLLLRCKCSVYAKATPFVEPVKINSFSFNLFFLLFFHIVFKVLITENLLPGFFVHICRNRNFNRDIACLKQINIIDFITCLNDQRTSFIHFRLDHI